MRPHLLAHLVAEIPSQTFSRGLLMVPRPNPEVNSLSAQKPPDLKY
jgi:hypothetical protein